MIIEIESIDKEYCAPYNVSVMIVNFVRSTLIKTPNKSDLLNEFPRASVRVPQIERFFSRYGAFEKSSARYCRESRGSLSLSRFRRSCVAVNGAARLLPAKEIFSWESIARACLRLQK